MGMNRNQDNPDAEVKSFRDERVCKFYLAGLCTHDLFSNTKMDLGICDKIHEDKLKEDYEEKIQEGPNNYGYEEELERHLDEFVVEVDKKIQRSQRRLEEDNEGGAKVDAEAGAEVVRLSEEISAALAAAEAAGEAGDVDRAQELMARVGELQQEKVNRQATMMAEGQAARAAAVIAPGQHPDSSVVGALSREDVNQKLRVCDVCGAFLSIYDSDSRLADHFGGKLHVGFVLIRQRLGEIREGRAKRRQAELQKRMEARDGKVAARREGGGDDRERSRERRDRERDRDRDRDRDRRDRDRDRDRERDRDRDRRERDRDGGRDGDRHREHRRPDRSRERDRDRREEDRWRGGGGGRDHHRERSRDRDRDRRRR